MDQDRRITVAELEQEIAIYRAVVVQIWDGKAYGLWLLASAWLLGSRVLLALARRGWVKLDGRVQDR